VNTVSLLFERTEAWDLRFQWGAFFLQSNSQATAAVVVGLMGSQQASLSSVTLAVLRRRELTVAW